MAKFYTELSETLTTFIGEQMMFFTATAPVRGRINISPKGMDTFRVIDEKTVAYLDVTGSGNETSAHVEENGRMTIMFCSFGESPLILRLYGRGEIVRPQDCQWAAWHAHFPPLHGERQIVVLHLDAAQTSCGFGVPVAEGMRARTAWCDWAATKTPEELLDYQRRKNVMSIDGLDTGLNRGTKTAVSGVE